MCVPGTLLGVTWPLSCCSVSPNHVFVDSLCSVRVFKLCSRSIHYTHQNAFLSSQLYFPTSSSISCLKCGCRKVNFILKLLRNRTSSERWLSVPSKSFFSKWAFQNWICKECKMQRSLSAYQVPLLQEYRDDYPERRRDQWHINLCSKHYCNWPGNNNCKPWKESDIHYYFSWQPKRPTQAWWRRFCVETGTRGGRRWNKGRVKRPKGWNLLGRIYCGQVVW